MDYKHSCVIDAQKLYKTFVLVMLVPTDDGAGVLDLGELGSASMTKLGQSDPALERAIGYIPGGLGKGATVYAGATDDGRVLYYALSESGAEAAIVLEDPAQEAVATYVGPRVYRDGAYHIVDDQVMCRRRSSIIPSRMASSWWTLHRPPCGPIPGRRAW